MEASRDDGILVLTTRERDWWWSMQEVIPALEGAWTRVGEVTGETVSMLCVPLPPAVESSLRASAPRLKRVVITCVTAETERIALLLRVHLKVDAPMTVYLCGDATEGFHYFGPLRDVLTEQDTFIVASEADAAATRCCFPNARVETVPFPLVDQFEVDRGERDARLTTPSLAYVGRISEQKNLHTLLLALWISRTSYGRGPELTIDFYGAEDNLGSPNMDLRFPDYGAYLQRLVELLGLTDVVTWHGFKSREWLFDHVHLEPHILVSPTLHSDENFGISVLASLVNGHQVVATAWGGHFGFREWFPQQLTTVPVHRSTMGPVVDPVLLANAIVHAADRASAFVAPNADLDRAREAFSQSAAVALILEMLSRPDGEPVPLEKSGVLQRIDEQRASFGGSRKIYESYEDPLVHVFFEAYGMKDPLSFREESLYVLPPWVSVSADAVRIDDPHRGRRRLDIDTGTSQLVEVSLCPSMETCRLPKSLVADLATSGYAFVLPPRTEVATL
ncbi:MAG TPA: glycosyltransferase [Actinomycetota bacterium]|nr:glycosyltransferase [Actinomycetota bacterium]